MSWFQCNMKFLLKPDHEIWQELNSREVDSFAASLEHVDINHLEPLIRN